MARRKRLYILINNHFDPTWRRCFDRPLRHRGQTFASYAQIRLAAMKLSEQGRAIILRLVEYRGTTGEALITLPEGVKSVTLVNLLERQPQPLAVAAGRVCVSLAPWKIATVRLEL